MPERKTKLLVLLTVFIDIIGLGIVIPILPFYVKEFSGSPFTVATLFAVYALCSFISDVEREKWKLLSFHSRAEELI